MQSRSSRAMQKLNALNLELLLSVATSIWLFIDKRLNSSPGIFQLYAHIIQKIIKMENQSPFHHVDNCLTPPIYPASRNSSSHSFASTSRNAFRSNRNSSPAVTFRSYRLREKYMFRNLLLNSC